MRTDGDPDLRVVFMGTPRFAVPSLLALLRSNFEVVGVFTKVDTPKGRGHVLSPSPVKECALQNDIPVFQPETLRCEEALKDLESLQPDIVVVVAYGKILPKEFLEIPPLGCINVHGSLLPKYRGAAPIQWAVINGETTTGITTIRMSEGLDTGDMLLRVQTPISPAETSEELFSRLSVLGAGVLVDTLEKLEEGGLVAKAQDGEQATFAPMLTREIAQIDWNKPADQIHNLIRGLVPWPVAQTQLLGKRLKIFKSRVQKGRSEGPKPGTIVETAPFLVCCGEGTLLEILELQFDSRKRMSAVDFLRGHQIGKGIELGFCEEKSS